MADSNEHKHKEKNQQQGGMGMRGVTRPMAEQEVRQHNKKMHGDGQHQRGDYGHEGHEQEEGRDHSMMMSGEMREKMLHMHHMQTLWVYWMIIVLGAWVLLSQSVKPA